MAEKEGHPVLWITLGTLAAVGVGYLVWKYAMSDEQKEEAKQTTMRAARKARAVMQDAGEEMMAR